MTKKNHVHVAMENIAVIDLFHKQIIQTHCLLYV